MFGPKVIEGQESIGIHNQAMNGLWEYDPGLGLERFDGRLRHPFWSWSPNIAIGRAGQQGRIARTYLRRRPRRRSSYQVGNASELKSLSDG